MSPIDAVLWAAGAIAAILFGRLILRGGWQLAGSYLLHRAGPRRLRASHHRLWRDPGHVEELSLEHGPGGSEGVPAPPFRFLEEHTTGSQPCVSVRDARGRRWRVKWGHEA